MPTYRVTDPNTGRTVKLEGDAPPTEQELDDIFKQLGSAPAADTGVAAPATAAPVPADPSIFDTITDVGKGVVKGAVSSVWGPARLIAELSDTMAAKTFGRPGIMSQPPPSVEPTGVLAPFTAQINRVVGDPTALDAKNKAQLAGKGLELISEIVAANPSLVRKVGSLVKKAPAEVAPGLGTRTSTAALPREPVPAAGGFSPPSGTGVMPGPAPRPILPEAVTTGTGAAPRGPIPEAGGFSLPQRPATVPNPMAARTGTGGVPLGAAETGGFGPRTTTGSGGWSMTVPAAEKAAAPVAAAEAPAAASGMSDLEKTLRASLADRLAKSASTTQTVEAVTKHVDEVASTVSPAAAADAIEKAVPQTVKQMVTDIRRMFGSERGGSMIYGDSMGRSAAASSVERIAGGPSRVPLVKEVAQLDSEFARRIADPRGAADPRLLGQIGGAVAGGAAGAAEGDTTEEKVVYGLLGAGAGALAVPLITHLATGNLRVPKAAQSAIYGAILSSPTSVAKAWLGAVGGTVAAATEKIAAGDVSSGARILRTFMSSGSVKTFMQAIAKGDVEASMTADAPDLVSKTIGRVFSAGDAVARRAMAAGGIGAEEASRYTLSGMPTTKIGQDTLAFLNKWFEVRLFTSMFPRVGTQILERGIERSPLGMLPIPGINEGLSMGAKAARAGAGTAAGAVAYAYQDQLPDWSKPYVAALSGVYALPVGMGFAAGKAAELGKSGEDQILAGVQNFMGNLPFPQYGSFEAARQLGSGASFIPNIVRDAAVAMDPYERDTSGGFFDRSKAKLPGLREQLPVRGRRVNIAGDPIADRSTPFRRVMNPAPTQNEPFAGIPENVASEVRRLGIELNPPSYEKTAKLGNKEVAIPPDAAERLQKQRREFVVPAIEKLLASASYQAAPDDVKKRRLEATINQAEERGSAKARALLSQVLRSAPNAKQR